MAGCKAFNESEYKRVVESFSGINAARDKALFILGCYTGFRITELLSITLGDIFQHGKIIDEVHVKRKNTKGKRKGRSQPIHPVAKEALSVWISILTAQSSTTSTTPLFKGINRGEKAITARQAWVILKNAYEAAGITGRTGTHCMRKSFAHNIHNLMGKDILKTKQALGHVRLESAVSYLEVDQLEINTAILRLK